MICPRCHARNPDDAQECAACRMPFVAYDRGVTLDGTDSSSSSSSPSSPSASDSPAPSSVKSGASSGTRSWSSSSGVHYALAPGSDFGPRYRIERLIGEGGMGAVYKAHDRELDRTVAIKLLQPGLMSNLTALQRFKQELLLASRVSHRNILRIHDLGDVDGIKFISMAYVEGEDLAELLRRHKRLPLERALHIARQLASALDAAHSEGVIHRDLKPQNILIDHSDQIYVSDFGLAKSLDSAAAGMTHAGQVLGTPRYMAPEQVEGTPLDHRADIYAFGLILYEMTTGGFPFDADSTMQLMYGRIKQKPRNPQLVNPEIPAYLSRLILRCLEREPFRRYQSARELLTDLESQHASSSQLGTASGTRSVQIALPLPASRKAWVLSGAAALVLILLLALAAPTVRNLFRGESAPEALPAGATAIPPLSQGKYVAVLPFRTLGGDESLAYIAEGLSEALSAKLFQLKGVRVAAQVNPDIVGQRDSFERIGRRLGVNLLVDGIVQSAGERLRIIVHLQDIAANRRLWSQEFSGLPADLLTLEEQVHSGLVAALELHPGSDELARTSARPTENIQAYDLYLRGRNALRAQQDLNNVAQAIRFFEQALEKDPAFPLAFAGLADASLQMYRQKKENLWIQRALSAAQRARDLNDSLPEVHFSLGSVYTDTGKTTEAIVEISRALELAPNSDEGYRRLGAAYKALGRKEEALAALRKALEINPYFWMNHNALGSAYLGFGDNARALESFRRVTELEPENPVGHENLASVFFRQGRWEDCIPHYQRALQLQPFYSTYSNLGTAYYFLKRYSDSVNMYQKAVELNPNDHTAAGNLADALRLSGQQAQAAAAYDRAISLAFKELEVNPRSAPTLGMLAAFYARKNDSGNATRFIRRARAIDANDVQLAYIEALVFALAGRKPDALRALRDAFSRGYPAREAANDPDLAALAADPAFLQLVREFDR